MHARWPGIIAYYREHLDLAPEVEAVTLLEGDTPLVACPRLAQEIAPGIELFLKIEGLNPTASFKDRGMTVAVSQAVHEGAKAVVCASTGNTSASAAAYAARAGIRAVVVVPHGNIAKGKLSQAVMHGAGILSIDGTFDQALRLVRIAAERYPVILVNSINPYRIEGQKTAAFEICDVLADAPDYHFLPVGNAGNITAYWKGYRHYRELGRIATLPRMMGYQAAGAAPIVHGHAIEQPETVATAIRIGNPASWEGAVRARDESGGRIDLVSDEEILDAYRSIAALEGIFVEPASATGVAGVRQYAAQGGFREGDRVVCTVTGHGLKDPDTALRQVGEVVKVAPSIERLAEFLHVA